MHQPSDASPPEPDEQEPQEASEPPRAAHHGATFVEVTTDAGIDYVQGPPHGHRGSHDFYDELGFRDEGEWHSGGAAAGDYDGDGYVDLYVTRLDDTDILYRNRGDGTFENVTAAVGLAAHSFAGNGAGFGDIDNDGDLDLYVTALGGTRFYLFINDQGTFVEEGIERGAAVDDALWHGGYSVAMADYDRDGWLDIHATEMKWDLGGAGNGHSRLLRNRGAEGMPGYFTDVTMQAGVNLEGHVGSPEWRSLSFTTTLSDLDDDGWPDMVVASDYRTSALFWNNGDGTFTRGTSAAGVSKEQYGMGSAVGDYDGDGLLDWFVTAIDDPFFDQPEAGNRLYRNNGDRTFADHTDVAGVRNSGWGWGTSFMDVDNDGDLDLTATNGYQRGGPAHEHDLTVLWDNDGTGRMTDIAQDAGVAEDEDGKGLLFFDYDADGDQDLFVVNHTAAPQLYRNEEGNLNDWLQIELVGVTANRQGIGARVKLQLEDGGPVQVREMRCGGNFLGQNETVLQFGLGAHDGLIHRVEIVWPTPGETRKTQVLTDIAINQRLVVTEPA